MTPYAAPRPRDALAAPAESNGHAPIGRSARGRGGVGRWAKLLAVPAAVALVAAGGYWAYTAVAAPAASTLGGGGLFAVAPADLDITVVKDGDLTAIDSIEIASRVEGQTTITYLVPEGTSVAKGDLLVELDSSKIRLDIEAETLEVREKETELQNARELLEIQRSTNDANLQAAEVELKLADLDLRQYTEGTFPQAKADAETALRMAEVSLTNKQGDYDDTLGLLNKGFVTQAELKKREVELIEARNAVDKARRDMDVLVTYQHAHDSAAKGNAVSQAQQKLERTKRENAANLAQKVNTVQNEEQAYALRSRKLARLQEQLAATSIKAPADGLVVYQQDDRGDNRMVEGATVRERQVMLRLPDTRRMKAAIKVNEGQVGSLAVGQPATVSITGVPTPVSATVAKIAPIADSGSRWWNPDLKEYPVDVVLDQTPAGAKPGVGVVATIYVERLRDVLAVPLPAIYSAGPDSYVFVPRAAETADGGPAGYAPVKVRIGATSDAMAQVADGLSSGDRVLLLRAGEGRELLDRAGIPVAEERRGPDREDAPDDKPPATPPAPAA